MASFRSDCEGFARRDFLKIGAAGLFGLTLPDLLRIEAQGARSGHKAKGVILIWLGGGPSTIDIWDLKPGSRNGGEFKPIGKGFVSGLLDILKLGSCSTSFYALP